MRRAPRSHGRDGGRSRRGRPGPDAVASRPHVPCPQHGPADRAFPVRFPALAARSPSRPVARSFDQVARIGGEWMRIDNPTTPPIGLGGESMRTENRPSASGGRAIRTQLSRAAGDRPSAGPMARLAAAGRSWPGWRPTWVTPPVDRCVPVQRATVPRPTRSDQDRRASSMPSTSSTASRAGGSRSSPTGSTRRPTSSPSSGSDPGCSKRSAAESRRTRLPGTDTPGRRSSKSSGRGMRPSRR